MAKHVVKQWNSRLLVKHLLSDPHLDWGIAVTFANARAFHDWLDSTARQRSLNVGQQIGILCATADMVIGEDGGVPSGVGFFRHSVAPGRADESWWPRRNWPR